MLYLVEALSNCLITIVLCSFSLYHLFSPEETHSSALSFATLEHGTTLVMDLVFSSAKLVTLYIILLFGVLCFKCKFSTNQSKPRLSCAEIPQKPPNHNIFYICVAEKIITLGFMKQNQYFFKISIKIPENSELFLGVPSGA